MAITRKPLLLLLSLVAIVTLLRLRRKEIKTKNSRVFIVTGAASGIGRHLADRLLAKGHKVMATDLNFPALEEFYKLNWEKNGSRCVILKHDVTSVEEWQGVLEATLKNFGALDVLLNIAGYIHPGDGFEVNKKQIDLHIDVNTKGMILGSQVAAQQMIKQKEGHIINISSVAGIYFVPGLALYSASKHGIRGFTRALAFELIEHNVHVTCVCPDAVQTPMLEKQRAFKQAAITFASPHWLTVQEIEKAIFEEVLPYRPHEVVLPWWRGTSSPFMYFVPEFMQVLLLKRLGGKGIAKMSNPFKG